MSYNVTDANLCKNLIDNLKRRTKMGKIRFSSVSAHASVPTNNWDRVAVEPAYLRRLKLKNPELPAEELAEYAFDLELANRILVARHPNTSVETLDKLASDDSARVRIAVTQNPKTTARILDKMLSRYGDDIYICRNIAVHPNTSAGMLNMLSHREDEIVLYNVARNPNTFSETLGRLLECEYESVRNMARQKSQAMLKQTQAPKPKFVPVTGRRCF